MGRGRPGTGVEPLAETIRLRFRWNGRRYYETLGVKPTAANIRAAERLMAQIKHEIGAGIFDYRRHFPEGAGAGALTDQTTFRVFGEHWLSTFVGETGTKVLYRKSLNKTWYPALGAMAISAVKHSDIAKAIAARKNGTPAVLGPAGEVLEAATRPVSGKTINNDMTPLRHIFAMALEDNLVSADPTVKFKSLKHQSPPPDPFTLEEMEEIVGDLALHAPTPVWAYYEFAFQTGVRPSEEIVLAWSRIDWREKFARIDTARTNNEEKGTKTHSVRDVDLTPRAIRALEAMRAFTYMKGLDSPVFLNPNTGRPWRSDRSQREHFFHPCLKRLKIRLRDAYQTRHTFATTALMGGVNPAYISRQLGHTNPGMLFKKYAKWIDRADQGREARKLAGLYADREFGHELATAPAGELISLRKSGGRGRD
jgi:integrase